MRITVLGADAVRPEAGGACAAFLCETASARFLVDCGAGAAARLRRHTRLVDLDGVFISHAHPDHALDLVMLRQALAHAPDDRRTEPLPIWAGPECVRRLEAIGSAFRSEGGAERYWWPHLDIQTLDPERELRVGDCRLTFARTEHGEPCLALRVEATEVADGSRHSSWAYTADTGPSGAVTAFVTGVDVLVAEATLPHRSGNEHVKGHLSAREAGEMAARAGVGRLVLCHTFASHDRSALRARAAQACPGIAVDVAEADDAWTL